MATVRDLVARANAKVRRIAPDEAARMMRDGNVLVVDVRDPPEVALSGKIRGAVARSRGTLEFSADPASPGHDPAFSKERTVLVYCASGGRAALAGAALAELGYEKVFNAGGFKELAEAGLETERGSP